MCSSFSEYGDCTLDQFKVILDYSMLGLGEAPEVLIIHGTEVRHASRESCSSVQMGTASTDHWLAIAMMTAATPRMRSDVVSGFRGPFSTMEVKVSPLLSSCSANEIFPAKKSGKTCESHNDNGGCKHLCTG